MSKFKRSLHFYSGANFPFYGIRKTGVYGNGAFQARHLWLGLKHIGGVRYSVAW